MSSAILTFNAGSSTVKFALYRVGATEPEQVAAGLIDNHHQPARVQVKSAAGAILFDETLPTVHHASPFKWIIDWMAERFADLHLVAAGHRVVHGASEFVAPVLIDNAVMHSMAALAPLAPLHQPHNLAAIEAFAAAAPMLPQVACFDTAFHHTMPALAAQFALPRALTEEGVRRYGFHGLSYEYIASVLPQYIDDRTEDSTGGRVIVAHLGSGASLCAMYQGRSVATTMGFTALDGLPMAERCGDLDPGVLLYLMKEKGMDYEQLSRLLYHQSGLLGVSGISGDMRVLEHSGTAQAEQAIALFIYRIGREIGSLAAALGGLDTLVFTGGIGEHSARVRASVCEQAAWLGVGVDTLANQRDEIKIHSPQSEVAVYRIPTDENQVIARATQRIIA